MPNIWKHLSRSKVQLYEFPDTTELVVSEPAPAEPETVAAEAEPAPEPMPDPETDPISYAQVQSESILRDARRRADEILEEARRAAEAECEAIREAARAEGREEGYAAGFQAGTARAQEENARARAEESEALAAAVQQFLEKAGAELDRQLDDNVTQLRDLAIAIAEKVVCVSLKSSEGVISRMIQTAIDKRKRREWVHIYIAECDAKNLTPIPASLSSALVSLSGRVRIIPIADDESGTCIIEMPDEIVDASATTQLNNIRSLLTGTPAGGREGVFQKRRESDRVP